VLVFLLFKKGCSTSLIGKVHLLQVGYSIRGWSRVNLRGAGGDPLLLHRLEGGMTRKLSLEAKGGGAGVRNLYFSSRVLPQRQKISFVAG